MKNKRRKRAGAGVGIRVYAVLMTLVVLTVSGLAIFQHLTPWKPFPQVQEQAPAEEATPAELSVPKSGVADGQGKELVSNLVYELPSALTYSLTTAESRTATAGVAVQANVLPDYATDKRLTWSVEFADASASWAQGKSAAEYVSVTANAEDTTQATIFCNAPFGAQILVRARSVSNPEVSGVCPIDFKQRIEGVTVKINGITLNMGQYHYGATSTTVNAHVENFPITNVKLDLISSAETGGAFEIDYVFSDAYTLALTEDELPAFSQYMIYPQTADAISSAESHYLNYDDITTGNAVNGVAKRIIADKNYNVYLGAPLYFNRLLFSKFGLKQETVTNGVTETKYLADMTVAELTALHAERAASNTGKAGYDNILFSYIVSVGDGRVWYSNLRWEI